MKVEQVIKLEKKYFGVFPNLSIFSINKLVHILSMCRLRLFLLSSDVFLIFQFGINIDSDQEEGLYNLYFHNCFQYTKSVHSTFEMQVGFQYTEVSFQYTKVGFQYIEVSFQYTKGGFQYTKVGFQYTI
jgi:hypothetical protein